MRVITLNCSRKAAVNDTLPATHVYTKVFTEVTTEPLTVKIAHLQKKLEGNVDCKMKLLYMPYMCEKSLTIAIR